ncbi:MAG: phosphotransferase [Anaerolineae bacterium]|nr:phosphotransferase [Anaerolineae bacterium]
MEPRIKARFNETILKEAAARYGIAADRIKLLDGFESFMFEFTRDGQPGILRLSHSLRRTPALIQAEVDWINDLAAGGAAVAGALFSAGNNLVEAVPDGEGGQFLVTAFARAPGAHAGKDEWIPPMFDRYGQLIGRMHALSKQYTPPHPDCARYHWDDDINMNVEDFLPDGDAEIRQHFHALLARLKTLPRDPDGYGLIHQDAHGGNFFVDQSGRITLFDFDDCCYGHYIYDLAMVVFYALVNREDAPRFASYFFPTFLKGYQRENRLDAAWFKEIPHFLKLREIDLYAMIHRSFGPGPYDDDPWVACYMEGRRERLMANHPFVEVDFTAFL